MHLVLPLRYPKYIPDIVTTFPTSLANGYDTYYWGSDDSRGMGFDDVTVPLGNLTASVNIRPTPRSRRRC